MWEQISAVTTSGLAVLLMGATLARCWSISRSLFVLGLPYWLLKLYLCNQDQDNAHLWGWLAGVTCSGVFILCSRAQPSQPDPLLVDLKGVLRGSK